MRIGVWEAVQVLAAKDPESLSVLADELAKKDYEIRGLREEVARLRSEVGMATRSRESALVEARRNAKRAVIEALADGYHALRAGGDVLIKDGTIAKVRCADPEKRPAVERAVRDDLGAWLVGAWSDAGEAEMDDIPF